MSKAIVEALSIDRIHSFYYTNITQYSEMYFTKHKHSNRAFPKLSPAFHR